MTFYTKEVKLLQVFCFAPLSPFSLFSPSVSTTSLLFAIITAWSPYVAQVSTPADVSSPTTLVQDIRVVFWQEVTSRLDGRELEALSCAPQAVAD